MNADEPKPRAPTYPLKKSDRDRVFVCAKCRLRGGTLRTVIEAEGRHVYVCFPSCERERDRLKQAPPRRTLGRATRKETPHGE